MDAAGANSRRLKSFRALSHAPEGRARNPQLKDKIVRHLLMDPAFPHTVREWAANHDDE